MTPEQAREALRRNGYCYDADMERCPVCAEQLKREKNPEIQQAIEVLRK